MIRRKNPTLFVVLVLYIVPNILANSPLDGTLRIQDLRNIECYAQPNRLEVCGAPDTLPILIFTKTQIPLEDVRIDVLFDDGIEYSGFAIIDQALSMTSASLDTISTENPEAPSFIIDQISEEDGAVVLYFGIRAECGVDFDNFNPGITFQFSFLDSLGNMCMEEARFEDYGANVITPEVVIANDPANTNLGNPNTMACQTIEVSQATPGSAASSFLFSFSDYGFSDGIMVSEIRIDGAVLDPSDYNIDSNGDVDFAIINPTPDGLLADGEILLIEVCYTYEDCFPNVDYFPMYTVLTACEGVFCSGDPDTREGQLVSNFPTNPQIQMAFFDTFPDPNICTNTPYQFDLRVFSNITDSITGKIESLRIRVRRCKSPSIVLDRIELLESDGSAVIGSFDSNVYTVLDEDGLTNTGVPTADRAGTVDLDLRGNSTLFGGGLTDTDGDGIFDDFFGDDQINLRFVYEFSCDAADLSCISAPNVSGGAAPGPDCQIRQIRVDGRSGCNSRAENRTINFGGDILGESTDTSFFSMNTSSTSSGRPLYNFGNFGLTPNPEASTLPLAFNYQVGTNDFTCPLGGNDTARFVMVVEGPSWISNDIEITNVAFEGTPVSSSLISVDRSTPGIFILQIDTGDLSLATPFAYTFDVTFDTALCSPTRTLFVNGYLSRVCEMQCDCTPSLTCTPAQFTVNPDSVNCVCETFTFTTIERVSTGFTNNTKSTEFDAGSLSGADSVRFISGDTMRMTGQFIIDVNDPEINLATRLLTFGMQLRSTAITLVNISERHEAMWDYNLARLTEWNLRRTDTIIEFGDVYTGLQNDDLANTGLIIGVNNRQNNDNFNIGEAVHPALPNGGYTAGSGNSSNDANDGRVLNIQIRNLGGAERNALQPFFDAIGGGFRAGDTVTVVWEVPLIDNPGWNGDLIDISARMFNAGSAWVNEVGGETFSPSINSCNDNDGIFQYWNPQVGSTSEINYLDDCQAEIELNYFISNPMPGWFVDEYRLLAGIEQFLVEFPYPYYYIGGATFETGGTGPFPIEPDSIQLTDTVTINGMDAYLPTGPFGQMVFIDAEFADGVRPEKYLQFYSDDLTDITTVGGTFCLIGFQNGASDTLTVRIPLIRACGDVPIGGLNMVFDAANKHLPDLMTVAFNTNNDFWAGSILDNDGIMVPPDGNSYLPFTRLGEDPVNRERRLNNADVLNDINLPTPLIATASIMDNFITDAAGPEMNTYMLCPPTDSVLSAGVLAIEVTRSTELLSISGDATTFTQAYVTDTSIIYAVDIPGGLAPNECFELALETDLLFCDDGRVCIEPILGCPSSIVPAAQQIILNAELGLDCTGQRLCYAYRAGDNGLDISFQTPNLSTLCSEQPYSVIYDNTGSSDLSDFMPILYLPEGLDFTPGSFMLSVLGGGSGMLTDPMLFPDSNAVYGEAYIFDQTEIDAILSLALVEPGDRITLTFNARTSCDFVNGFPISSRINSNNACAEVFGSEPESSNPIYVSDPDAPEPMFEFNFPDDLQISCGTNGTNVLITSVNVGKAATGLTNVMITLPAGLTLDVDSIEFISPKNFDLDPTDITVTNVGGGNTMYSFDGPDSLEVGATLCLNLPFLVNNLECGIYDISLALKQLITLTCETDMMECDVLSLMTESPFIPIEVVPIAAIGEAEATVSCGSMDGLFDVNYTLNLEAPGTGFNGNAIIELFRDINGNGELDMDDIMVAGTTMNEALVIADSQTVQIMGTFTDVDAIEGCPSLIRFEVPGCTCMESIFPIPEILPDFIVNLGEAVALCAGEERSIEGICGNFQFVIDPPNAGTVIDNMDGTVDFRLNDGFTAATLNAVGSIGFCPVDLNIPVTAADPFNFGPYTANVCSQGSQLIDLNIPPELQEDLQITISPTTNLDMTNAFEPVITDLQNDQVYTIDFNLNDSCFTTTTLTAIVEQAPEITVINTTACQTGFLLANLIAVSPEDLDGSIRTYGDGTFEPNNTFSEVMQYIPGPEDLRNRLVRFRFATDDPEGTCGPDIERAEFNILLVDCGTFPWSGND